MFDVILSNGETEGFFPHIIILDLLYHEFTFTICLDI
jgi:hypothetical protein